MSARALPLTRVRSGPLGFPLTRCPMSPLHAVLLGLVLSGSRLFPSPLAPSPVPQVRHQQLGSSPGPAPSSTPKRFPPQVLPSFRCSHPRQAWECPTSPWGESASSSPAGYRVYRTRPAVSTPLAKPVSRSARLTPAHRVVRSASVRQRCLQLPPSLPVPPPRLGLPRPLTSSAPPLSRRLTQCTRPVSGFQPLFPPFFISR